MLAVGEHGVALSGYPDPAELARQVGKIRHLDAGDVIEIAGIIAVAANAVSDLSDPVGNRARLLVIALPLAGNAGGAAVAVIVTLADAGDEHGLAGLKTRRLQIFGTG